MNDRLERLYGSINRRSILSRFVTPKITTTFTLSDVWNTIEMLSATRRGPMKNEFLDIIIEVFKKKPSEFSRFVKRYISKKISINDAIREILGYLPIDRTRERQTIQYKKKMNPGRRLMDGRALEFMSVLTKNVCRNTIKKRIDLIESLDPLDAEILLYRMMFDCLRPYPHILATFPKEAQEHVMTVLYDMMMRDTNIKPDELCVLDQNLYQLFLAMHNPPMHPDKRFVRKITTGMMESAAAGHTHDIQDLLHHTLIRAVDIPYAEYFTIPDHDTRVDVLLKLRAAQQTHLSRKQISFLNTMYHR